MDHPGDHTPEFKVLPTCHFQERVVRILRLEKDFLATLNDLQTLQGKLFAQLCDNNLIVGGGDGTIYLVN